MSNALRMFIRESLVNEAVGQRTWFRTAEYYGGSRPTTQPAKGIDLGKSLWSGISSLGKGGYKWLSKRKLKSGVTRTGRPTAGGMAARAGILGVIVGAGMALAKRTAATDDAVNAKSDEILSNLIESLETIKLGHINDIVGGYLTPEILSAQKGSDIDQLIVSMNTNYSKKVDAILSTKKLNDFFTNPALSSSYSPMQADINQEIASLADQDMDVKQKLENFVFAYLLSDTVEALVAAADQDTQTLQAIKDSELDDEEKGKISAIGRTQIGRIESNPQFIASRNSINEILSPV